MATSRKPANVVDERIPESLRASILEGFLTVYLEAFDLISEYNKEVLAEKDSEWSIPNILKKAQELGNPDDASKVVPSVKEALDAWSELVNAVQVAKRNVLKVTAEELGITLNSTVERNDETEAPLKEKRKDAVEIGKQLANMAGLTKNESDKETIKTFLDTFELPQVGREGTRSFTENDGKSTPKYRVKVTVSQNDTEIVSEDGFTKTANAVKKYYPRGAGITSDKLREVWEGAGNKGDVKAQSVVEFTDKGENGELHYVLTQK